MKKSYLLLLAFFIAQSFQAQNIIPLIIDSSYTYEWGIDPLIDTSGIGIDTFTYESFNAYSYDANDSLIQVRHPNLRLNWEYLVDTTYHYYEVLINGGWTPKNKITISYLNGKPAVYLRQGYQNNSWTNLTLILYTRNAAQQLTQELLQSWVNNTWQNSFKTETSYYLNGLKKEEKVFLIDINNQWSYSRGQYYEYDNNNNQTLMRYINPGGTGSHAIQFDQIFGSDNLIDTIVRSTFPSSTTGTRILNNLTTFQYFTGRTEKKTFHYSFNTWILDEKAVSYDGQGVYSSRPDSILYYQESSLGQSYSLTGKRHLHYQELANDIVYFLEEKFTYFGQPVGWARTLLNEEWYHLKTPSVKTPAGTTQSITTFPNPCRPGTPLNIGAGFFDKILIFDELGRLVASQTDTGSGLIQAPMKQGVYTLVLMKNGELMGRAKQVVME